MISNIKRSLSILRKNMDKDRILIYQMGKVGSTTIEAAIDNSEHMHSLYFNEPCGVRGKTVRLTLSKTIRKIIVLPVKRFFIKRRSVVKIITVVRDPVARNISMFFQDIHYWLVEFDNNNIYDTRQEGMEYIYKAFLSAFDHDYYDRWFDSEIKRFTGIDVFKIKFDKKKGMLRVKEGRFDIIFATAENLNSNSSIAMLEEFIGAPITLDSKNVGGNKWYGDLYGKFKKEFPEILDYKKDMKSSKTYKHFY